MSTAFEEAIGHASLRQRAAEKLTVGIPTARKRASQSEALAVLHQLASSPSTAGAAMALLHELQVHQVELDLQHEELRRSQSELETALMRQATLVERAPAGYLTIDANTVLCEINLAGARLLGAAREDLLGRPLAGLLASQSVSALQALLERARESRAPETCELQLVPVAGAGLTVQAAADQDTTPERFMLVLMAVATTPLRQPSK
jgi:PAS domain S-box-containing protein